MKAADDYPKTVARIIAAEGYIPPVNRQLWQGKSFLEEGVKENLRNDRGEEDVKSQLHEE